MFSGIVEETGRIELLTPTKRSVRLVISSPKVARRVRVGESVAVNGVCLTVAGARKSANRSGADNMPYFDVLKETMRRTNLRFVRAGDRVNLERSLRFGGRVSGHFVTGHVDGVGRVKKWEKRGRDYFLEVAAPAFIMKWLLPKGSIAVDGISLTIAELRPRSVAVWIIPHTREVTNLRNRQTGDVVNLEGDLIGKYTRQFLLRSLSNKIRTKRSRRKSPNA